MQKRTYYNKICDNTLYNGNQYRKYKQTGLLSFWKLEYEQNGRGEVIGMLFYLTWYFIVITKTLQNNNNNNNNKKNLCEGSCLIYVVCVCLVYNGVQRQHILGCSFILFAFVLCTSLCCQFLWIAHF